MNSLKFAAGMLLSTAPFAVVIVGSMVAFGPWVTLGIVATVVGVFGCIWGGHALVDSAMNHS